MEIAEQQMLTVGQAARRLGIDVKGLLDLVYRGRLQATVQPSSGRILLREDDLRPFAGASDPQAS